MGGNALSTPAPAPRVLSAVSAALHGCCFALAISELRSTLRGYRREDLLGAARGSGDERASLSLVKSTAAFMAAYAFDMAVAAAGGGSTLYAWKPSEVLLHHVAGVAGPAAVFLYDLLYHRISRNVVGTAAPRPRHKSLEGARLFLVSSLLTSVNEAVTAAMALPRSCPPRLVAARKLLGFVAVAQVFVAEWATYYCMFVRRLLRRERIEVGEVGELCCVGWLAAPAVATAY